VSKHGAATVAIEPWALVSQTQDVSSMLPQTLTMATERQLSTKVIGHGDDDAVIEGE
jgi:hypothetical protein